LKRKKKETRERFNSSRRKGRHLFHSKKKDAGEKKKKKKGEGEGRRLRHLLKKRALNAGSAKEKEKKKKRSRGRPRKAPARESGRWPTREREKIPSSETGERGKK